MSNATLIDGVFIENTKKDPDFLKKFVSEYEEEVKIIEIAAMNKSLSSKVDDLQKENVTIAVLRSYAALRIPEIFEEVERRVERAGGSAIAIGDLLGAVRTVDPDFFGR